ncbi:hypothetical protein PGT21_010437 [Puccinia graminis f. sp. tritici]|uniref:Uncharacterized protein n=1 Tax=Puccinia graminis f. sp. tritici TaxID=56615 RepID=A0A5B0MWC4_PUCGR|nr:hypothetical protein PGT21_010437 [Puccinia graminis f. sp. tritici]
MDWKLGWRIVASDWARWPGSHHADGQVSLNFGASSWIAAAERQGCNQSFLETETPRGCSPGSHSELVLGSSPTGTPLLVPTYKRRMSILIRLKTW